MLPPPAVTLSSGMEGEGALSPYLLSPESLCLAIKVLASFSRLLITFSVLSDQRLLPPDDNAFGFFFPMPFAHKGLLPGKPALTSSDILQSQFQSCHCGALLPSCPRRLGMHSPAHHCWLSSSPLCSSESPDPSSYNPGSAKAKAIWCVFFKPLWTQDRSGHMIDSLSSLGREVT